MVKVWERIEHGGGRTGDIPLLNDLGKEMLGKCFCPLGKSAVSPVASALRYFKDEVEHDIAHGTHAAGRDFAAQASEGGARTGAATPPVR